MIKPSEFIHPEDEKALKVLKAIPGFTSLMKKYVKYGAEMQFHGENMASAIRLSPLQLPEIYRHLPPICEKLGIEEPDFYLMMNPVPNAYTFGDTKIFIVVTSALVEMLDDEELDAVLAHECGHIICRHTLYKTMARILWGDLVGPNLSEKANDVVAIAYYYWSRKAELSCDRVASLVTSPDTVSGVMARLSGGPKSITANINMKEWAKQADEYDEMYKNGDLWNKAILLYNTAELDHPYSAVRVREIYKWCETDEYNNAKGQLNQTSSARCRKCGKTYDTTASYCTYCGNKL